MLFAVRRHIRKRGQSKGESGAEGIRLRQLCTVSVSEAVIPPFGQTQSSLCVHHLTPKYAIPMFGRGTPQEFTEAFGTRGEGVCDKTPETKLNSDSSTPAAPP